MVVLVEGAKEPSKTSTIDSNELLAQLLPHMPVKAAAKLASDITGEHKNALYSQALALKHAD